MIEQSYLQWLADQTPTSWWHDSADPAEIQRGLLHKASGITTNPILVAETLEKSREYWKSQLKVLPDSSAPVQKAELLLKGVVCNTAKMLEHQYKDSHGERGYVCAQVNPSIAANATAMMEMARRFSAWAPNVSVKLPATAAGMEALEQCAAEGISVTATVSFTVPQAVAVAERYRKGMEKAIKAGKKKAKCFSVIMIGRIDEYLRDIAEDIGADVSESDIRQAGIAITKRAYSIFIAKGYEATLLVAALRGTYHMQALTGAKLIMSIHPKYQQMLICPDVSRNPCQIDTPVDTAVIKRLRTIPDFVRAYEPDGMKPREFMMFGLTQRTLTQFSLSGWGRLEKVDLK